MIPTEHSKLLILHNQSNRHTYCDSFNTTEESLFKAKFGTPNKCLSKNHPKLLKFSPLNTQSSEMTETHSILTKFQREIKKQFTEAIDKDINELSQTSTTLKMGNKTKHIIKHKPLLITHVSSKEKLQPVKTNKNKEVLSITSDTKCPAITTNETSKIKNYYKRIRQFNIKINTKWKSDLGLQSRDIISEKCLMNDLKYQSHYIKGEMKVLLDNIQYYKMTILTSNTILSAFKNKDIKAQINHNKIIEEQCGILNKLPKLLLMDFYEYADKFISIPVVSVDEFNNKEITNEANCYVDNARLLNKLYIYLKCCFEVYTILIKEADNIILKPTDFEELIKAIQKARFNMNLILFTSKNWINDLKFDLELVGKFRSKLLTNQIKPKTERNNNNKKDFISNIMHNQLNFRKNEQVQKIRRINNALRPKTKISTENEKKLKNMEPLKSYSYSLIKSTLMTKLLRHCKKDAREQIISLRTVEMFHENALSDNN